jgi:hypothetical protein
MLVAPWRKHLGLTFASSVGSGDLHDIRHAKPSQLANLPCTRILVREPPADELVVFSTRRVGKNRNSRRDAALHEIRRFERPRAAGTIVVPKLAVTAQVTENDIATLIAVIAGCKPPHGTQGLFILCPYQTLRSRSMRAKSTGVAIMHSSVTTMLTRDVKPGVSRL